MKEATGELNVTIIVVIAVGILIAFFYYVIWPGLDANFQANSKCTQAVCENPCKAGKNTCDDVLNQLVKCTYKSGQKEVEIYCPWKG